jgi:hypothetical protein
VILSLNGRTKKGAFFSDYKEYHTDTNIDFNVTLVEEQMKVPLVFLLLFFNSFVVFQDLESKGMAKSLKLVTTMSVNNLMAFAPDGKIKKYETVLDIMKVTKRQHDALLLLFKIENRIFTRRVWSSTASAKSI